MKAFKAKLRSEKELLLTSDGRPVALLLNINPDEDPSILARAVRDSRSRIALSRIREAAAQSGAARMTATQIEREIQSIRKTKKP